MLLNKLQSKGQIDMAQRSFLNNQVAQTAVLPLQVAIYRACKDQHGSISAIAEIHGFDRDYFNNQIDVHKTNSYVSPEGIEAVISYTKDPRILDSICAAHGEAGWFELPNVDELDQSDFMHGLAGACNEVGNLSKTICESISDDHISSIEYATIDKNCMAMIRAALRIRAMAKAKAGE